MRLSFVCRHSRGCPALGLQVLVPICCFSHVVLWLNWESLCLNAKREFQCLYWAAADISWSIYCFSACGPYVIRRLTENCCKGKKKMIVLGMQRSDKTKWPKGPKHCKLNWRLIYLKKQLHWEPRPSVSFMLSKYFLLWFIYVSN